jgi:uncharacterized protein YqcC (DUF446 family)
MSSEFLSLKLDKILKDIEAQLKSNGDWSSGILEEYDLIDMGDFGINTMEFPQWMQFVMLPRLREMITNKDGFPTKSQVALKAEEVYSMNDEPTEGQSQLIMILEELDGTIGFYSEESKKSYKTKLENKILEVENQLKVMGVWKNTPIDENRLVNMGPFGMNTLTFFEWLQYVFIPNERKMIENDTLPSDSQVSIYAHRDLIAFGSPSEENEKLVEILFEHDELFEKNNFLSFTDN